MNPLVTVICLCYNHEQFVKEALLSVIEQSYNPVEIIIVDDFSTDRSVEEIESVLSQRTNIKFVKNSINLGNCKSFNSALKLSKGKYIIDFATDDVMLPERIQKQVDAFEKLDSSYGVIFSNAVNIDQAGNELNVHYSSNASVPFGEVYKDVLERYFISPPTMMMKREVLEKLGGYDEILSYEDFDFWVRSARNYKYHYQAEVLTKRRVVIDSHSSKISTKRENRMIASTYRVVQKALWLNKTSEENEALVKRIKYEMRHAFYIENFEYVKKYFELLKNIRKPGLIEKLLLGTSKLKLPIYTFYKCYVKLK